MVLNTKTIPTLQTERLILRQLRLEDAPHLTALIQAAPEITDNTLNIPHPYTEQNAVTFIESQQTPADQNPAYNFAMVRSNDQQVMGVIGLHINDRHRRGMLGYWIGKPFWGQGYTSEAARRLIQFGFEEAGLMRIFAECFTDNIGSARVMEKSGMTREGLLRQVAFHEKSGTYRDFYMYAILRGEYEANQHGA